MDGYRQTPFGTEAAPKEGEASLDPRQVRKVIDEARGKLPLHQLLPCRLRFLTGSYVPGSEEFVKKEVAEPLRLLRKRKKSVRPKPAGSLEGLAIFPAMHGQAEGT